MIVRMIQTSSSKLSETFYTEEQSAPNAQQLKVKTLVQAKQGVPSVINNKIIPTILLCQKCKKSLPVQTDLKLRPGPHDFSYTFHCVFCNKGQEYFCHSNTKSWVEVLSTALYNLSLIHI
eukprot:TRINITY_DN14416_c0_g1_i1.p1 TRINITY_DN14416_c0_g1~~TRINITY_DN14416_c0_g1_i1.p1  ORF type:complete len:120 (+),score=11.55 TRINITY_DN14416_c0_g1_i1:195-554(+)